MQGFSPLFAAVHQWKKKILYIPVAPVRFLPVWTRWCFESAGDEMTLFAQYWLRRAFTCVPCMEMKHWNSSHAGHSGTVSLPCELNEPSVWLTMRRLCLALFVLLCSHRNKQRERVGEVWRWSKIQEVVQLSLTNLLSNNIKQETAVWWFPVYYLQREHWISTVLSITSDKPLNALICSSNLLDCFSLSHWYLKQDFPTSIAPCFQSESPHRVALSF